MNRPLLIFESSPLYLLLCLVAALGISWFFYKRGKYSWPRVINNTLFVIRSVLIFFILALLLSPILKYIDRETERPIIVVGIDNSTSVTEIIDSVEVRKMLDDFSEILPELNENGFDTKVIELDGTEVESLNEISYDDNSSNLMGMLNTIQDKYVGRNLHSVVLMSDGIYNSGSSPIYPTFSFNIFTIGVGDSIPKKDISIQNIRNNRVSYQGNKFPIQVNILNEGFGDQSTTISLFRGSEFIESRTIRFVQNQQLVNEEFLIEAKEQGTQRFSVIVKPLDGEFTEANNTRTVFIDIIEGKENILLLSERPHPDIKSIRQAVESNPNYTFEIYIKGVSDTPPSKKKYDLIICHQCTGVEGFISSLPELSIANTPMLILYGKQLNTNNFNQNNGVVSIEVLPGQFDSVTPVFNTAFSSFELGSDLQQLMRELPPVVVPFGSVNFDFEAESMLFQRVGSIETAKPLIVIKDEEPRRAVVLGEGIWRWRLHDFLQNKNNVLFNELVSKLIQYLSTKDNKQRLKVYPVENQITDQSVVLETEAYNELYERIFGVSVNLSLTDEGGNTTNYDFAISDGNSRYRITGLSSGVYNYRATSMLGNENHSSQGQFVIKDLQLEYLNLTADFNLLRNISAKNNGKFFHSTEIKDLPSSFESEKAKGIIHSFESYNPLINLPWIFYTLMLLASTEWFLRKYYGAY